MRNDSFYVSVEEAELAVVETAEGEDGYTRYTVLFEDGEIEDCFDGDVYETRGAAEAYYADVLEQCLV